MTEEHRVTEKMKNRVTNKVFTVESNQPKQNRKSPSSNIGKNTSSDDESRRYQTHSTNIEGMLRNAETKQLQNFINSRTKEIDKELEEMRQKLHSKSPSRKPTYLEDDFNSVLHSNAYSYEGKSNQSPQNDRYMHNDKDILQPENQQQPEFQIAGRGLIGSPLRENARSRLGRLQAIDYADDKTGGRQDLLEDKEYYNRQRIGNERREEGSYEEMDDSLIMSPMAGGGGSPSRMLNTFKGGYNEDNQPMVSNSLNNSNQNTKQYGKVDSSTSSSRLRINDHHLPNIIDHNNSNNNSLTKLLTRIRNAFEESGDTYEIFRNILLGNF